MTHKISMCLGSLQDTYKNSCLLFIEAKLFRKVGVHTRRHAMHARSVAMHIRGIAILATHNKLGAHKVPVIICIKRLSVRIKSQLGTYRLDQLAPCKPISSCIEPFDVM